MSTVTKTKQGFVERYQAFEIRLRVNKAPISGWFSGSQNVNDFNIYEYAFFFFLFFLFYLFSVKTINTCTQTEANRKRKHCWLGPELFCLLLGPPRFNCWFSFAPVFQWCCSTPERSPGVAIRCFCRVLNFVSSQYLSVIYLFPVMIHWWVRKPSLGPNNFMFWAITEAEGRGWDPVKPV